MHALEIEKQVSPFTFTFIFSLLAFVALHRIGKGKRICLLWCFKFIISSGIGFRIRMSHHQNPNFDDDSFLVAKLDQIWRQNGFLSNPTYLHS